MTEPPPPPPSSLLDDDIFDAVVEEKSETSETDKNVEIDLVTSTENVHLEKKSTTALNDDLFFSTISDPVDLEDSSAEPEVIIFGRFFFK